MGNHFFTKKQVVLFVAVAFFIVALFQDTAGHAQTTTQIWGAAGGGSGGDGVVFSLDSTGNNMQTRHQFSLITPGRNPAGNVILYNGLFYGMTPQGGANNKGIIFSYDTLTGVYTDLYDFGTTYGSQPQGDLVVYNNKLYGTAMNGGANSAGVVFSFDPATNTYADLHDFDGNDGANPNGNLVVCNSKLYGATYNGGAYYVGQIFSVDPATNAFIAYDFDSIAGAGTYGGTLLVYNNTLYGVGYNVSSYAALIYSFDPSASTLTDLYDIPGSVYFSGAFVASGNKFYGTTGNGLFSFDPSNDTYTDLYDNGQFTPDASLQVAGNKMYGMSNSGGSNGDGFIFSYDFAANIYTELHDFSNNGQGAEPQGGLLLNNNKLYGMTTFGGTQSGVLFSYDTSTNNYSRLISFNETLGQNPNGILTFYNSKLYGITNKGGDQGWGILYSIDPYQDSFTVLYDFSLNGSYSLNGNSLTDSGGLSPMGNLVAYGSKLWGMTTSGGDSSAGTIFSYDPLAQAFTKVYSFGTVNGSAPNSDLCPYNGKLYGVSEQGGADGNGVIFSFDTATNVYTDLYDISAPISVGGFLTVYNNKLYGIGDAGGANNQGVIFSFDPANNTYTDVYDLDGIHGGGPINSTSFFADTAHQKLYATAGGGAYSAGVILSFAPATGTYTDLYDFNNSGGVNNFTVTGSDLIEYNGKLWGSTTLGGTADHGIVFSIDTTGSNFTVLQNFTTASGATLFGFAGPANSRLTLVPVTCTGAPTVDSMSISYVYNAALRDSFVATQGGGQSYHWDFGDGSTDSTLAPAHTYANPGTYTVTLVISNFCGSDTVTKSNVVVNCIPAQPGVIQGSATVCSNGSQVYSIAPVPGADSYTWNLPSGWNGNSATDSITISAGAAATGEVISVTANNSSCGSSTPQFDTVVVETPIATANFAAPPIALCQGQASSVLLQANSGTGFSYQWKFNNTVIIPGDTSIVSVDSVGNYTVTITDSNGCANTSAIVTVAANPLPVATVINTSPLAFCQGDSVSLQANTNISLSYQWLNNGAGVGDSSAFYTTQASGIYQVAVIDNNGCRDTSAADTVIVYPLPVPVISVNGNVLSTGVYTAYQWYQNGHLLSGGNGATFTVNDSGIYTVTVTDANGCIATSAPANISLGIAALEGVGNNINLYPNPNNGTFIIEGTINNSKEVQIEVLNVIGQTVYQATVPVQNGNIKQQVFLSDRNANGIYQLRITTANGSSVLRFVMER